MGGSPLGPLLSFCACRGGCRDEGGAPLVEAPAVFHGKVDCVIPLLVPECWAGQGRGGITYTTLGGSLTCVHNSAVGKYSMLLSSRQLFILLRFCWKTGHTLAQLACPTVPHDTQCSWAMFLQVSILWRCAQVPHVSKAAEQSWAKCPQLWHVRQWRGSFYIFLHTLSSGK